MICYFIQEAEYFGIPDPNDRARLRCFSLHYKLGFQYRIGSNLYAIKFSFLDYQADALLVGYRPRSIGWGVAPDCNIGPDGVVSERATAQLESNTPSPNMLRLRREMHLTAFSIWASVAEPGPLIDARFAKPLQTVFLLSHSNPVPIPTQSLRGWCRTLPPTCACTRSPRWS